MRALLIIALIIFGFAAGNTARAADLPVVQSGYYPVEYGARAGMLLVYDNQPGVLVRTYWGAPWRDHHYFPATGKIPRIGRAENLNMHSALPRPAKTFKRQWSNDAALHGALEREQPTYLLPSDSQVVPRNELPSQIQKP